MSRGLLIFGATGQTGQELMALAAARGIAVTSPGRTEVDITDGLAVASAIESATPRLIVNLAAYTAVDKAESEPDLAVALNASAPGIIARAAARQDVPVIHISTDYVFDGTKEGAYEEDDPIAPLNVYGRTKSDGEAAVRSGARRHVILRTSWVYGAFRQNFLRTILRLAAERDYIRVVQDQRGCPTSTLDLAEAILAVDLALASRPHIAGTFHFAGAGATSWHGFASEIVAAQAAITGRCPVVEPIAATEHPTHALRPMNSELDSTLFAQTFGYRAGAWDVRTREVVSRLLQSADKS